LLSGEAREYSIDKRYLAKDGRYLGANSRVSLVRDPSGEPSYFISVIEDINEREGAELALRSLTARDGGPCSAGAGPDEQGDLARALRQ
jgi:hypothetical protein